MAKKSPIPPTRSCHHCHHLLLSPFRRCMVSTSSPEAAEALKAHERSWADASKRSIRRPASVRAAKAKAKPAPKNRPDPRAKRNQKKSPTETWLTPQNVKETSFPVNSLLEVEFYYCHELGKAYGKLVEIHQERKAAGWGFSSKAPLCQTSANGGCPIPAT